MKKRQSPTPPQLLRKEIMRVIPNRWVYPALASTYENALQGEWFRTIITIAMSRTISMLELRTLLCRATPWATIAVSSYSVQRIPTRIQVSLQIKLSLALPYVPTPSQVPNILQVSLSSINLTLRFDVDITILHSLFMSQVPLTSVLFSNIYPIVNNNSRFPQRTY